MPLAKPKKGEKQKEFISRCMADTNVRSEFQKQNRIAGYCFSAYKQSKKKQRAKGSKQEPTWDEYSRDYVGNDWILT